jgi:hypothetical protein
MSVMPPIGSRIMDEEDEDERKSPAGAGDAHAG